MLVQRISIILSACNMQISNSKLCEVLGIYRSKPPLLDEHAFPLTEFTVAWFGCSLHLVAAVG